VVEFQYVMRLAHARQRTRELDSLAGQEPLRPASIGMIKTPPEDRDGDGDQERIGVHEVGQ